MGRMGPIGRMGECDSEMHHGVVATHVLVRIIRPLGDMRGSWSLRLFCAQAINRPAIVIRDQE
jgi:hypothetical protein